MANNGHVDRVEFEPFPVDERWDTDLTPEQYRRLHWKTKERRSMVALRRKVAVLQEISTSLPRVLAEASLPDSRKALRDWRDPLRGLWSWVDVKLDNPSNEKNKDVIEAFFKALSDIDKLKRGKNSVLRRQVADKKAIIERLELRNIELLEEIARLRVRLSRTET